MQNIRSFIFLGKQIVSGNASGQGGMRARVHLPKKKMLDKFGDIVYVENPITAFRGRRAGGQRARGQKAGF